MPRSPWLASAGCTKKAGVPVEASVAAVFAAICPLLPMPVTMTRPSASPISAQVFSKVSRMGPASIFSNASRPAASMRSVRISGGSSETSSGLRAEIGAMSGPFCHA